MNNNPLKMNQQGMTLIEIMIALTIGTFLLTGVVQVFSGSKQTYRMQDNLSRMQENARFAMEFISRDIRMADYWGCIDGIIIERKLEDSSTYDNFNSSLAGLDNNADTGDSIVDGTDSMTLRGMDSDNVNVTDQPSNISPIIQVDSATNLTIGDVVVVSNCSSGDLFQITNLTVVGANVNITHDTSTSSPGNKTARLEIGSQAVAEAGATNLLLYTAPEANIAKLMITDYQIRNSGGIPSLSREINGGGFQALVNDIENMQILYGEDTDVPVDGTPNHYVSSTNVADMDNVVSVRVSLLIRSTDDNLTMRPRTYTYNAASITPTDRRLRRVFTSTIVLRNRLQ